MAAVKKRLLVTTLEAGDQLEDYWNKQEWDKGESDEFWVYFEGWVNGICWRIGYEIYETGIRYESKILAKGENFWSDVLDHIWMKTATEEFVFHKINEGTINEGAK